MRSFKRIEFGGLKHMAVRYAIALLCVTFSVASAQRTTIDLASQAKNADFSNFPFTRPISVGSALPSSCQVGQFFYNSAGNAGTNLYGCVSTNNWATIGGYTLNPAGSNSLGGVMIPANSGLTITAAGALSANVGTSAGTVAAGNDSRIVNALQPQSLIPAANITGLAPSATIDTTNASDITSGTLSGARLPAPTASTLGGINSIAMTAHQWINSIGVSGTPSTSQPAFTDLSGTVASAQLPVSTFDAYFPMGSCPASSTPALAWDAPTSGNTAAAAGCSGTNVNQAYASFANIGTPALLRTFTLPPNFVITNGADIFLTYLTSTANGTFTLAIDAVCTPTNGTATNDPSWTANNFFAPPSQTAPPVANQVQTISIAGISWPAGCTPGSLAHFRLIRTDTSGTAGTVLVTGVTIIARRTL